MRLREVVSGRSAFAWRRRCARSTSWLRELSSASARLADHHLIDFRRWNTPAFGAACLTELTNAMFHDAPAGESAQAARRAATAPADRQANSRRGTPPGRAVPAGEVAPVRPTGAESRHRVPVSPPQLATVAPAPSPSRLATVARAPSRSRLATVARAPSRSRLATVAPALSRSRLAELARDIPRVQDGSGPSRMGHRNARRSVPMPGAVAAEGSVNRPGAATIAGAGGKSGPDPATASTILARRVNARAGDALADAFGSAFLAGRPPLSAAAGWARTIAEPHPGLVLIDADRQLPSTALEAGPRTAPESRPGRRATAQPTASSSTPSMIPQTEPAFTHMRPLATTRREGLIARNSTSAETDAVDGTPVLDPPTTTAHFGALTALDRRHGYLPPVAAPLSVAESRAEERHRFDPLEFAEHVRVALIDDARRYGIGV